ncbi:MAG: YlxR family protein [Clostridia bacterium]|nr:YlxR family protein [Clostridia bacterium]
MCVGCRQKKGKRELIRIVRTPEMSVVIDETGKKAGRGAYICPQVSCLEKAIKSKALERALLAPVDERIYRDLKEQLQAVK